MNLSATYRQRQRTTCCLKDNGMFSIVWIVHLNVEHNVVEVEVTCCIFYAQVLSYDTIVRFNSCLANTYNPV